MTRGVTMAIICDGKGRFLMGKRKDTGKWTCAGGHLEKGELPLEGLAREVKEETGLDIKKADLVTIKYDGDVTGYVFKCEIYGEIDFSKDPDEEFSEMKYVDVWEVRNNLHFPWSKNWLAEYWRDN
jgi:8-oxo-dGTP pyrophosphatase MutT (NUDIX family)